MRKTWFITLTMTLATLTVAPGRAAAQVLQVPPPGAPRPADVSARPETKERHHTDAGFAQQAAAAGKKEVDSATFASREASNTEVKALAQRLVKDHTATNQELDSIMRDRKGASTDPAPAPPKAETWRTETGASFDRAYVKYVIDQHEEAIELFEEQSAKGTDPELKAWAKAKLPTLRDHLKLARELRSTLGS
jgi:putative membrane protein